jgi:acetyl esterase
MQRLIYKTADGRSLTADVFHPSDGTAKPRACVGCFHGGGWAFGKPEEYHEICRRFAAAGYVAVSFSYRLSIHDDGITYPHPSITPIEASLDARDALRWLHAQASTLGIDTQRIVLAGQSAGGQLAMASVLCDEIDPAGPIHPRPAGLLLYSSNHNTVEAWCDNLLGNRRTQIWAISPRHQLRAGLPPMRAFHGADDSMVSPYIVQQFQQATEALGNQYQLTMLPGRGHYLGDPDETFARYVDADIIAQSVAWLNEVTC